MLTLRELARALPDDTRISIKKASDGKLIFTANADSIHFVKKTDEVVLIVPTQERNPRSLESWAVDVFIKDSRCFW